MSVLLPRDTNRCTLRVYLEVTPRRHLARRDPLIHDPLQIALQPPPKVIKHGAAARQDNVRVQPAADVDRRVLDHLVDDLRERGQEVGRVDLGVEKDFGREEPLVADVDRVLLRARRVATEGGGGGKPLNNKELTCRTKIM